MRDIGRVLHYFRGSLDARSGFQIDSENDFGWFQQADSLPRPDGTHMVVKFLRPGLSTQ